MSWLFEKTLASLFQRRTREAANAQRLSEQEINDAVEMAVEGVHPQLKLVYDYKGKLRSAVAHALDYIDHLVANIPGGVEISPATFSSDPRVNAFFANGADINDACRQSSELREFFEADHVGQDACYALVCMRKKERNVFGLALDGEMLRRDVPQVTVSFSDHQIQSPATSEREARDGLEHCIYQSLINQALGRISGCKSSLLHLETERRNLSSRLRRLKANSFEVNAEKSEALGADISRLKERLRDNAQDLVEAQCSGPRECLEQLRDVMAHPEQFIRVNHSTVRLTRLGVKVDDAAEDRTASTIDLAEVEMTGKDRRIVLLARLPRVEFGPRRVRLQEAERYLAF